MLSISIYVLGNLDFDLINSLKNNNLLRTSIKVNIHLITLNKEIYKEFKSEIIALYCPKCKKYMVNYVKKWNESNWKRINNRRIHFCKFFNLFMKGFGKLLKEINQNRIQKRIQ